MKKTSVHKQLEKAKPGVLALFDPDRMPMDMVRQVTEFVCEQGVAGILVGSSLLVSPHFDAFVDAIKKTTDKPVIIFPGCSHQVCSAADAIFFLSLLSGRNAHYLVGEQVKAVFVIREYGIEVIPVGYMLIESGSYTAVEFVSGTKPIPRNKSEIAVAHALTGEYFGMKYIYLEAGSGAQKHVPLEMVRDVKMAISIPLIVGGGIRTAQAAQKILEVGADYVVLGSIIEQSKEQFREIMRSLG